MGRLRDILGPPVYQIYAWRHIIKRCICFEGTCAMGVLGIFFRGGLLNVTEARKNWQVTLPGSTSQGITNLEASSGEGNTPITPPPPLLCANICKHNKSNLPVPSVLSPRSLWTCLFLSETYLFRGKRVHIHICCGPGSLN